MNLPDWVNDKTSIRIVAGDEVVARKLGEGPWMIKTQRCVRCGMCCLYGNYNFEYRDPDDDGDGRCIYIGTEDVGGEVLYRCAHPEKPWSCVRGTGEDMTRERYPDIDEKHFKGESICSIRYKKWR